MELKFVKMISGIYTIVCIFCVIQSSNAFLSDTVENRLARLENRTRFLEQDIKTKNDLTQFLQANVVALNSSLVSERNKTATLEAKVAALEKRLQNQISSSGELAGDVKSASNLAKSVKADLDLAKQDIQNQISSLNSLNQTVLQSITSVGNRIDNVNLNITTLQQTLAQATNGQRIYFTYRNSDPQIPPNTKTPLKFHGRVANQGNAYDETTGIFSAPVDGVYWFSLTLGVAAQDFMNCYIVQNGQLYLVEVYTSAYSAFTSASSAVTISLSKGDKVSVSGCHGNGTISAYKSSFTGMLVHEE